MKIKLAYYLSLALTVSGCGSGFDDVTGADSSESVQVKLQVIYRDSQCQAFRPGIQILDDAASWIEWRRQQDRRLFSEANEPENDVIDIDFSQFSVIVISMGQRPTPGYTVDVRGDAGVLDGGVLNITSVWEQPPEDAILAQVLTSPCVAITVPRAQYNTVKVRNQYGDFVIDQRI